LCQSARCAGTDVDVLVTWAVEAACSVQGRGKIHFVVRRLGVWDSHNRATDLCVGASSSALINAAPPSPSAPGRGDPGSTIGGASASGGEGEALVSSATGRVSGEGSISMAGEHSSCSEMIRRLPGAGTSAMLSVSSGDASSFEGAGRVAPSAPGDGASLQSGEEVRGQGTDSEPRRGWLLQGA
jgi:hypothetical protein